MFKGMMCGEERLRNSHLRRLILTTVEVVLVVSGLLTLITAFNTINFFYSSGLLVCGFVLIDKTLQKEDVR